MSNWSRRLSSFIAAWGMACTMSEARAPYPPLETYELSLTTRRNLSNVECNMALPWNCTDSLVVFLQPGLETNKSRLSLSGLTGARCLILNTYLVGANLALDYTTQHHLLRMGWGLELGVDGTAISFNQYLGHKGDNKSPQGSNSTASGYDISIVRYWEWLPWLESNLYFERYKPSREAALDFGDAMTERTNVAYLFQIGMGFNPIPIVKAKVNYGFGHRARNGMSVDLIFKFRIGEPLVDQLSPGSVPYLQSLDGRIYSTVNRSMAQALY